MISELIASDACESVACQYPMRELARNIENLARSRSKLARRLIVEVISTK